MIKEAPRFFATPSPFRRWLEKHHDTTRELWVGFYKKNTGKPSITWPESVDAALCFGWIDGLRKSIDESSYRIRFTPRNPRSTWSAVNIKRVAELTEQGLMYEAGLKVFRERNPAKSDLYSYERRREVQLSKKYQQQLRSDKQVWSFFQSQPPWYQRTTAYWIMSAKREKTQVMRLAILIDCSRRALRIPPLKSAAKT
ncbi:MAG TPA: YdeI/OmpD-associated family protein [Acidobacteriota bacterium]|nr:YdeI/OmpD-associated family protein [Acidobacteriota bacterium]